MKAHLSNAAYGVLDYAIYPIGMLVADPVMTRTLGVAQWRNNDAANRMATPAIRSVWSRGGPSCLRDDCAAPVHPACVDSALWCRRASPDRNR